MSITIQFHKDFQKQATKLKPAQQKRLREAMRLFREEPMHPSLYNHPLTGQWNGYRSLSFGGDWRVHFELTDKGTVAWFVACGTHSQLYK